MRVIWSLSTNNDQRQINQSPVCYCGPSDACIGVKGYGPLLWRVFGATWHASTAPNVVVKGRPLCGGPPADFFDMLTPSTWGPSMCLLFNHGRL